MRTSPIRMSAVATRKTAQVRTAAPPELSQLKIKGPSLVGMVTPTESPTKATTKRPAPILVNLNPMDRRRKSQSISERKKYLVKITPLGFRPALHHGRAEKECKMRSVSTTNPAGRSIGPRNQSAFLRAQVRTSIRHLECSDSPGILDGSAILPNN